MGAVRGVRGRQTAVRRVRPGRARSALCPRKTGRGPGSRDKTTTLLWRLASGSSNTYSGYHTRIRTTTTVRMPTSSRTAWDSAMKTKLSSGFQTPTSTACWQNWTDSAKRRRAARTWCSRATHTTTVRRPGPLPSKEARRYTYQIISNLMPVFQEW